MTLRYPDFLFPPSLGERSQRNLVGKAVRRRSQYITSLKSIETWTMVVQSEPISIEKPAGEIRLYYESCHQTLLGGFF
jgi:hypothetical protein